MSRDNSKAHKWGSVSVGLTPDKITTIYCCKSYRYVLVDFGSLACDVLEHCSRVGSPALSAY